MTRAEPVAMGVKAFAQAQGVSPRAVRRAAHEGRLTEASIGWDRRRLVIRDAELARREWAAHSRPRVDHRTAGRRQAASMSSAARPASPPVAALLDLRELLANRIHPALVGWLKDCEQRIPAAPDTHVRAVFERWGELPAVLMRLEDGMREAGVPLLAEDMPAPRHSRKKGATDG